MTDTQYGPKWLLRGLYATAIAINLWYLGEMMRDSDEGQQLLDRVKSKAVSIGRVIHGRVFFRDHADDTIRQAEEIVKGE